MNKHLSSTHAAMPATESATPQHKTVSRILLAIGAAGPLLFLTLATLLGLLDPGYDAWTRPISELALGPNGWLQTANFYLFSLAIIAFALGLFRSLSRPSWAGTGLLIVAGLGMAGAGVFPTDLKGTPETGAGVMHNLLFLVMFLALILSYIPTALSLHRLADWRGYAWATALMPLVVFALLFVFVVLGSDPGDPLYAVSGLIQRILIAVAFGWMTVTALRLLSAAPAPLTPTSGALSARSTEIPQ